MAKKKRCACGARKSESGACVAGCDKFRRPHIRLRREQNEIRKRARRAAVDDSTI